MPFDYSRFDKLEGLSDDEEEDDGTPSTESGMMLGFQSAHEQRLEADRCCQTAGDPRRALDLYDGAAQALLALEAVQNEKELQSVAHRQEMFHARLGAARLLTYLKDWEGVI